MARIMNELQFQSECFIWFNNTYRMTGHLGRLRRIKNELDNHPRKTPKDRMIQLNENKVTGVIPGDSDFYWIAAKNTYIELKLANGVQSDDQKEFERIVRSWGHDYVIIKEPIENFKKLIIHLINESQ